MNICAHCGWPENEHQFDDNKCPDYTTATGWLDTVYQSKEIIQ